MYWLVSICRLYQKWGSLWLKPCTIRTMPCTWIVYIASSDAFGHDTIKSEYMKNKSNILATSLFFIITAFLIIISTEIAARPSNAEAQAATATASSSYTTRLSDYAWSDNIGWISFKDGAKPVIVSGNGDLNGYAWSENIGWIRFGGLSGFPNTSSGANAKVAGGRITGWARVVSGVAQQGVDNRGGFDGWISLSGSNYGVTVNGSNLGGYAWGSDVVGWVDMSGVTMSKLLNPCTGPYGTVIPDGQNFTFFSKPDSANECASETRTCVNGFLTGSLGEISCGDTNSNTNTDTDTSVCSRGGKTFNAGDKVVFYAKAIAGRGQTCESLKAELTCQNGGFVNADGNIDNLNKNLRCISNPSFSEQ